MSTVAATADTFNTLIEQNDIVIVDFWAAWCGPCRAFAPAFEAASERHPDVIFAKVDTDAEQELAGAFRIRSIPTLMLFRGEVLLFEHSGMIPGEALDEIIAKAKSLDMEKVRAELAAADAASDAAG
jgi:thioredoxin 1